MRLPVTMIPIVRAMGRRRGRHAVALGLGVRVRVRGVCVTRRRRRSIGMGRMGRRALLVSARPMRRLNGRVIARWKWRARRHLVSGRMLHSVAVYRGHAASRSLRRDDLCLLLVRVVRAALSLLGLACDVSKILQITAAKQGLDSRLASFLTHIRKPWSEKLVDSSDVLAIPGNCFAV